MSEHLSDGKFAPRDVTEGNVSKDRKGDRPGRFVKGHKRGGRPPGRENKITRDVKVFLAALVSNVRVQDAVEARIEKGDTVAFFRALEHVVGKPKETSDIKLSGRLDFGWIKDEE